MCMHVCMPMCVHVGVSSLERICVRIHMCRQEVSLSCHSTLLFETESLPLTWSFGVGQPGSPNSAT